MSQQKWVRHPVNSREKCHIASKQSQNFNYYTNLAILTRILPKLGKYYAKYQSYKLDQFSVTLLF